MIGLPPCSDKFGTLPLFLSNSLFEKVNETGAAIILSFKQQIGRIIKVIEDKTRVQPFNDDGEHRTFPVSIFYPVSGVSTENHEMKLLSLFHPASDAAKNIFSKVGIDEEALNTISISVLDNAMPELHRSIPVVVFSPGFGIDRDLYIETITSIVESGYAVVTVGVPYDTLFTVFPDGRVVLQAERFPSDDEQVRTRMQDIQLVIEHLRKWNEEGFLRGMFDMNRIGMMGHSLGGASVFKVAAIDDRVRCIILFDASLHLIGDKIPNIPLLNMRQEAASFPEYLETIRGEADDDTSKLIATAFIEGQSRLYDCLPSTRSFVKIVGANHLSFSTVGRLIGALPPSVTATIQRVTLAFLQEFLNDDQGAYTDLIHGVNRPSNLVEINGIGLAIEIQI